MANSYFQFKQFMIRQDKCAMKVGTDGVLLGAWVDLPSGISRILDVGTGSGLIALMLAQRTAETFITAIDVDRDAYLQAVENVSASVFKERIQVSHLSLNAYVETVADTFELIVSNPPYFNHALLSPDIKRTIARHSVELSLDSLIADSRKLLAPNGRIALILPADQQEALEQTIKRYGFFMTRLTAVIPTVGAVPKRILVEITTEQGLSFVQNRLTIESSRHQYTDDYIALTKAFYLKM
ncbi:methyltransferase [Parabacteroides sp. PF5-9]|uniref:tRNA1(Val) (adenine(37)-N6)-methyltransferase n=1 Tax=Parabacteroides sp. PF5-9 TaxID=1742404 RepID=UPI002473B77B|nr:methyltransferase [Parabacteroides sp. PF5-9]MDH6358090.1 tRNA1Val (adenine37-N6)-methyltransferase [Parabacteroides sp. PF5-9]